jgi:hypothetical protein
VETNKRVLAVLDRPPPAGFARWTGGLIAAELGDVHEQQVWRVLREQRIDLVIDLARDRWNHEDDRAEREAAARLGIPLLSLRGLRGDGSGDPGDYVEALAALARARGQGQRVLVHCRGGSERTGNFFLLYRTLFEGWSASDAFAEYARYRNKPRWETLSAAYLDAHVAEIAASLVARGALTSVPDPLPVFAPAVAAAR